MYTKLSEESITFKNLTAKQVCCGCPESYHVFDETKKQVGYLKLRGGYFSVRYPNSDGETIFEHKFEERYKWY